MRCRALVGTHWIFVDECLALFLQQFLQVGHDRQARQAPPHDEKLELLPAGEMFNAKCMAAQAEHAAGLREVSMSGVTLPTFCGECA
jgi:hypothetical protein